MTISQNCCYYYYSKIMHTGIISNLSHVRFAHQSRHINLGTNLPFTRSHRYLHTFKICEGKGRSAAPQLHQCTAAGSSGSSLASGPVRPSAILMESDAAVVDLHSDGHRVAFNRAFDELRQAGDGTATGMLKTWFNSVGWPTVLGTGDHGSYATAILRIKDEILQEMLRDGDVPLRPGVADIIDSALEEGVPVALIGATCSGPEEEAISAASFALGARRSGRIRFFNCGEPVQVAAPEVSSEDGSGGSGFEAAIAAAKAQVKLSEGEAFVEAMKGVGLDPGMVVMQLRTGLLTPAWLLDVAGALDADPAHCIVIAANEMPLRAAKGANMVAVAVSTPSSRGRPAAADAFFADGYGPGGGLTWNRIKAIVKQSGGGE